MEMMICMHLVRLMKADLPNQIMFDSKTLSIDSYLLIVPILLKSTIHSIINLIPISKGDTI